MNRITYRGDERDFLVWREGSGGTVEIFDIAVNSERRVGIGTCLIHQMLGSVPPATQLVFAITRASNSIAREFYEGFGFFLLAKLPYFYANDTTDQNAVMYAYKTGFQKHDT